MGRNSIAVAVDVSDEDAVNTMVKEAIKGLGCIDILVNNAGIAASGNIQDISLNDWKRTINVNLTGTFLCCKATIGYMIERGYGKIVNLSSISGQTGRSVGINYSATKTGIIGITRTLALEVAKYGINVNAVAPGPITETAIFNTYPQEIIDKLVATVPYNRPGLMSDVANLILFLASDRAAWITGEVVAINGGAFMG